MHVKDFSLLSCKHRQYILHTNIKSTSNSLLFNECKSCFKSVVFISSMGSMCFKRDITKLILISITKDCPSLSDAWIQWVMLFIHSTHASNLSRILMSVNFVILSVVCVYFSIKTCEVKKILHLCSDVLMKLWY